LDKEDVPECEVTPIGSGSGLGWDSWLSSEPHPRDAADPVFEGIEVVRV
jgi:predicted component of type VI protein secretion system